MWKLSTDRKCGKPTYGIFGIRRTDHPRKFSLFKAHRVSWYLSNGEIPSGMIIMHKCDVPGCCNPKHLVLGTDKKNAEDRKVKGRSADAAGKNNGNAKLTEQGVVEIIRRNRAGESQASLARAFGVGKAQACKICHGETWKNLDRSRI